MTRNSRRRSPSLAVLLSFVWPGWGHWYLGRRRAALGYAFLTALATVGVALALSGGPAVLAARLFVPSFALSLLGAIGALALLRLLAMADAWRRVVPAGRAGRSPATALLGVLMAVIVASHGAAGYLTWAFYDASSRIFTGQGPAASPGPSPSGGTPTPTPGDDFFATPNATPESKTARITVLFTGIDTAPGRTSANTDTLLVVSVDPDTKQAVMVSFPRDIADFPLHDGRTYSGKINSLMAVARLSPKQYPEGPLPTLTNEIGYLLGVPVNYFAAVNVSGFPAMIKLVGGVDLVNPRAISDPSYDWLDGHYGFYLKAGQVHLDGRTALAFARSRTGAGDNDFTRAARQQLLLSALREKLLEPALIAKLPAVLDAATKTVRTNFPPERLEEMITLGQTMRDEDIQRFVLGPPYSYHPPTTSTGGVYTLRLYMDKLAALSVQLFGADSRYYAEPTAGP